MGLEIQAGITPHRSLSGGVVTMRTIAQRCLWLLFALLPVLYQPGIAEPPSFFNRALTVTTAEPVCLDVQLAEGDLEIAYSREGQVLIKAESSAAAGININADRLAAALILEQVGNHLTIRNTLSAQPGESSAHISYRIDVPYRTEVNVLLGKGKVKIIGVLGPVKAETSQGDIKVSYVSKGATLRAGSGDLDLQVIGEAVEARTGNGNISCARAAQKVNVETGNGDISLAVIGPSKAVVASGSGRIEIGGARGSVLASTIQGDIQVKAVPHDDWRLTSSSGNIRIELPLDAGFEIDADTDAGQIISERPDFERIGTVAQSIHQTVNRGGKHVMAHTGSGRIVIR